MAKSIFRFTSGLKSCVRNAARNVRSFCNVGGKVGKHKGIILGLLNSNDDKDYKLSDSAELYDRTQHDLIKFLLVSGPELFPYSGSMTTVEKVIDNTSIVMVGQDEKELETYTLNGRREKTRLVSGIASRVLKGLGVNSIIVDGLGLPEAAAEGAALSTWSYPAGLPIHALNLLNKEDEKSWEEGVFNANLQNFVRHICEIPTSQMDPTVFCDLSQMFLANCPSVKLEVRNETFVKKKGLHAFVKLASGSLFKPSLIEIDYAGADAKEKPFVFVGNCLMTNVGDASLKHDEKVKHKGRIACGAITIAIMKAISTLKLNINATAFVPVYHTLTNTSELMSSSSDQQGRLVMGDLVSYSTAKNPGFLFTISSNTRGHKTYICPPASNIYTNTSFLWREAVKASDMTGTTQLRGSEHKWRNSIKDSFEITPSSLKSDL